MAILFGLLTVFLLPFFWVGLIRTVFCTLNPQDFLLLGFLPLFFSQVFWVQVRMQFSGQKKLLLLFAAFIALQWLGLLWDEQQDFGLRLCFRATIDFAWFLLALVCFSLSKSFWLKHLSFLCGLSGLVFVLASLAIFASEGRNIGTAFMACFQEGSFDCIQQTIQKPLFFFRNQTIWQSPDVPPLVAGANPRNVLGGAVLWLLLGASLGMRKSRFTAVISLLLFGLLVLTLSVKALLVGVFAMSMLVYDWLLPINWAKGAVLTLCLLACTVFFGQLPSGTRDAILGRFYQEDGVAGTSEHRMRQNSKAFEGFWSAPLLGNGTGATVSIDGRNTTVHNFPLSAGFRLGLPGFVLAFVFILCFLLDWGNKARKMNSSPHRRVLLAPAYFLLCLLAAGTNGVPSVVPWSFMAVFWGLFMENPKTDFS